MKPKEDQSTLCKPYSPDGKAAVQLMLQMLQKIG
jgi:hypothetical protein